MIPQSVLMRLATLGLDIERAEAVAQMLSDVENATRTEAEAVVEKSRTKARERVQRWREKQAGNVTERNTTQRNATQRLTRAEDNLSTVELTGKVKRPEPAVRTKSTATRIPDDFAPDIEWAVARGLSRQTAQFQAEKFRSYWLGAKQGSKADWPATWRTWVLTHIERSGTDAPVQASSESSDEQWVKRLIYARQQGVWSTTEWGPSPGSKGCRAPPALLKPGDGDGWKEWVKAA